MKKMTMYLLILFTIIFIILLTSKLIYSETPKATAAPVPTPNCNQNQNNFDTKKCMDDFEKYTGIRFEVMLGDNKNLIDEKKAGKERLNEFKKTICDNLKSLTPKQKDAVKKIRVYSSFFTKKMYEDKYEGVSAANKTGIITLNEKYLFDKTWTDYYPNMFSTAFMHEVTHILIFKMRHDETGSYDLDSSLDKEWKSTAGNIYAVSSGSEWDAVSGGIVEFIKPSKEFPNGGFIYKEDASKKDRAALADTPKHGVLNAFSASFPMEDMGMLADYARFNPKDFKKLISDENPWNDIYKKKLDLLNEYRVISNDQYKKVLENAGFPVPPQSNCYKVCKLVKKSTADSNNPFKDSKDSKSIPPLEIKSC
jgi:hypothetical protein